MNFIGLANFQTIFTPGEQYLSFISNTLVFTMSTSILKLVLGMALALLLNEGIKRFAAHRVPDD